MNPALIVILLSGVLAFLFLRGAFLLIKRGKKEAEGIGNLSRMGTPPDSFVIKGSPEVFVLSVIVLCAFVVAFSIFGYLFWKGGSIDLIHFTPGFVLAVLGFGALAFFELRRAIVAFCTFFNSRLRVEGLQFVYTDWLRRTHVFDIYQVVGWNLHDGARQGASRSLTVGNSSSLQYKDSSGKTHRLRIGLSVYSQMLLSRYLDYYWTDGDGAARN